MLLGMLVARTSDLSAVHAGAVVRSYSTIMSVYRKLVSQHDQRLPSTAGSSFSRGSAVYSSRLTPAVTAAASGSRPASFSTRVDKRTKSQREAADAAVQQLKSMQHVRGIGKKYELMLHDRGIQSVEQLSNNIFKQLEASAGESIELLPAVKYLQELGIRRNHAQRIITHLTSVYAPELHTKLMLPSATVDANGADKGPEITFCVEGNISAGKSTFLEYITNNNEELQHTLGVVHEPVDQWQKVPSVEGGTLNLLDRFYQDPEKYAYTFQNYVFMSRVLQERNSSDMQKSVRLMERSVFSDRMVFVRAVRESGWMGDVELAVYDSWFGPILDTNPSLKPDGFIYLKVDPSTCMNRLKQRARSEETTVTVQYLEGLHAKHEDWLGSGQQVYMNRSRGRERKFKLGARGLWVPVPERLQQSLYYLDAQGPAAPAGMHSSLQDVPALVLDCNEDVLRNLDLQREVQAQVAEYIDFMRQYKAKQKQQQKAVDNGTSSSGFGMHRCQPGAPEGRVAEHYESIKSAAQEQGAIVVSHSSGRLSPDRDHAEGVLSSSSSRSATASGSLEVLHTAAQKSLVAAV